MLTHAIALLIGACLGALLMGVFCGGDESHDWSEE